MSCRIASGPRSLALSSSSVAEAWCAYGFVSYSPALVPSGGIAFSWRVETALSWVDFSCALLNEGEVQPAVCPLEGMFGNCSPLSDCLQSRSDLHLNSSDTAIKGFGKRTKRQWHGAIMWALLLRETQLKIGMLSSKREQASVQALLRPLLLDISLRNEYKAKFISFTPYSLAVVLLLM